MHGEGRYEWPDGRAYEGGEVKSEESTEHLPLNNVLYNIVQDCIGVGSLTNIL